VSAELNLAGVKIIVLVECKNYLRRVGVDEIMEFATRIDDIGAHKGIVVTAKGFERGAFKIAKSKGIALVEACDLGWGHRMESPVAAMMRHKAFVENVRAFLVALTDASAAPDELDRATTSLSRYDVTSALGSGTAPLRSLVGVRPGLSSLQYAGMFARDHAFIVRLEAAEIVLGSNSLFKLAALELGLGT